MTKLKWHDAGFGSYAKGTFDKYEITLDHGKCYYLEINGICVVQTGGLRMCKEFAQDRENATVAKSLARQRIRTTRPTSTGLPREDEM